jgi:hypothetical protein
MAAFWTVLLINWANLRKLAANYFLLLIIFFTLEYLSSKDLYFFSTIWLWVRILVYCWWMSSF